MRTFLIFICLVVISQQSNECTAVQLDGENVDPDCNPHSLAEGLTLEGGNVLGVELKGEPTDLVCSMTGNLTDSNAQRMWLRNGIVTVINGIVMGTDTQRLTAIDTDDSMTLRIDPVTLADAGKYVCQLGGAGYVLQAEVQLAVNKLPETSYTMEGKEVVEGTTVTLATCSAASSKPAPEIWYEDQDGNKVQTDSDVEVTGAQGEVASYTLPLISRFYRKDHLKNLFCRVAHQDADLTESIALGQLDVKFSPTVKIAEANVAGNRLIKMEGEELTVNCMATGNPAPIITWQFSSDVPNATLNTVIPANFITNQNSDDVKTVATNSLVYDTGSASNNGTYTCTADNGIGDQAQVAFELGIYEIPTTTPAPTTQVPTTEFQMVVVGADTAVIAGVIAVAAFVLIVTIILLMRYFMSHKGEYYTNELKISDADDDDDDDDALPVTEADLLGQKKKTEHFL